MRLKRRKEEGDEVEHTNQAELVLSRHATTSSCNSSTAPDSKALRPREEAVSARRKFGLLNSDLPIE
jgi:hypothetical protein